MTFNVLSVIVMAIFVICIVHGARKGFVRIVFSLISIVLSIYLAFKSYPYLQEVLLSAGIEDSFGILSFILMYVLIRLVLAIIAHALDLVSKLPVLHTLNKFFGGVAGFVHGMLIVWLFMLVITLLADTDGGERIMTMVRSDSFLSTIYQNDPLLQLFSGLQEIFSGLTLF